MKFTNNPQRVHSLTGLTTLRKLVNSRVLETIFEFNQVWEHRLIPLLLHGLFVCLDVKQVLLQIYQ